MAYKTISEVAEASFIERRSEFIGYIAPVTTNEQAVSYINQIRERHRKATHNVYAYILREGNTSRYSDDGEPQGTAGIPVLDVLQKRELTDVCCVVTRYFGGILLGGGGLVRAYSHSATIAVDASHIMEMCDCYTVSINIDYNMYGKLTYILPDFDIIEVSTDFLDTVTMQIYVKKIQYQLLHDKLIDSFNGKISINCIAEGYQDFNKM